MPRPFELLDSVETPEGLLELRRRGDKDFMILVGGRVLMTSTITTSELALAENGCGAIAADSSRPRVLIGGLGLGFTLRAALDALPRGACVHVAELNEKVIAWCQGPAAAITKNAANDPRVHFIVGDVTEEISRVADDETIPRYDAILWDLYIGPQRKGGKEDPLYGDESVMNTWAALREGGVFGVWGETPSTSFEERLKKFAFAPELIRTGGSGLKHAVYLATKRKPKAKRAKKTKYRGRRPS